MRLRELRVMGQFNRHGSPRLPGLRNHASEGCRAANRSIRSEEHTSELQSHSDLVCRLLLEKKKKSMAYYANEIIQFVNRDLEYCHQHTISHHHITRGLKRVHSRHLHACRRRDSESTPRAHC